MAERVYVAASFEQKEQVRALYKELEAAGHSITADWTTHKEIAALPSDRERKALKQQYAVEDTEGVKTATVYGLLLGDRKSTGAHIELGVALGAEIGHICLIGIPDERQLFYDHPSIDVVPDPAAFVEYVNSL